jgi:hypothetical protein
MDEFFKMDIFFVITSITVVVIGVALSLVLYRIYRILENVERITKHVSEEAEVIRRDIAEARGAIKREGFKLKHAMRFFSTLRGRRKTKAEETPE